MAMSVSVGMCACLGLGGVGGNNRSLGVNFFITSSCGFDQTAGSACAAAGPTSEASLNPSACLYAARDLHWLDPSESSIQAANKFLEEWRAYLHSLVANIRYHAITDVNEGGEGKVTILLKESFLASFEGRDKSFMRSFVETQMFATYADDRLASES